MKRFSLMFALAFLMSNAFAAETTNVPKTFLQDPFSHPSLGLHVAVCLSIMVLVLVIFVIFYISRVLRIVSLQNKALNNFLPPWWKGMVYTTVGGSIAALIGFFYIAISYIHGDPVVPQRDQVKVIEASLQAPKESEPTTSVEVLVFSKDSVATIARGKTVFGNFNCASCHRQDGGGNAVGPNLTDEYWLHGGEINDVMTTIKNGVGDKGMPAWGGALSAKDLKDVTFFVLSLQGTNPVDAKEPQGTVSKGRSN
jgi:cytochrome c oxidase cbb3-type subunit III